MKILGVDPGTRRTGAGIIEANGNRYTLVHFEILTVPREIPIADRLRQIHQFLCGIVRDYRPDVLALENVFYGENVPSMVKIGEARACAMLAASESGIDVVEYPPARVKQAVTGNGQATKEQMRQMVKRLLNMKTAPPTDGADALAVAICHLHSRNHVSLLNRQAG